MNSTFQLVGGYLDGRLIFQSDENYHDGVYVVGISSRMCRTNGTSFLVWDLSEERYLEAERRVYYKREGNTDRLVYWKVEKLQECL